MEPPKLKPRPATEADPEGAARLKAEARRAKILAKGSSRMQVVSGEKSISDIGLKPDDKQKKKRRSRPAFMTRKFDPVPVEAVAANSTTDPKELSKAADVPATVSTKSDPVAEDTTTKDGAKKGNKRPPSDHEGDSRSPGSDRTATTEVSKNAVPGPPRRAFSDGFRQRVARKKSTATAEDPLASLKTSLGTRQKTAAEKFAIFNKREGFLRVVCLLFSALLMGNAVIVHKMADMDDSKIDTTVPRFQRQGEFIFTSMDTFPIQNMAFIVFGLRIIISGIFTTLRFRYYPLLSASYKDSAGNLQSLFDAVKLVGEIFDDVCVFLFGLVAYFLTVYYLDMIPA